MKSLPIQSSHYNYLLKGYKEYLQILGYSDKTVKNWPVYVREFFHWLENKRIPHITQITAMQQLDFMGYINKRYNNRNGGALSSSSINSIVCAIHAMIRYVNSMGRYSIDLILERAARDEAEKHILSIAQIKILYDATFTGQFYNPVAYGQRDRAMIALYYGCGLRRAEGIGLNINDINLTRRLVFIKKGKGGKQRYVPIAAKHVEDISDYIQEGRQWILEQSNNTEKEEAAFLLNRYGRRLQAPDTRLNYLLQAAGLPEIVSLHSLRHSIATHLLQSGMNIEDISKFLGHGSLVSTQVYTHIVNEELKIKNDETEGSRTQK